MSTRSEAVKAAQAILKREFPSLYVTGEWDRRSQRAFDNASHDVRVGVIKAMADRGHSLNDVQNASLGGFKAMTGSVTESLGKAAAAVARGVRTAVRTLTGAETRFLNIAISRGLTQASALHLMAQVRAESHFEPVREDHRYSPARARQIFSAMKGLSDAQIREAVGRGRESFFEIAYGHKTSIGARLGNTNPGDGGRYYGRGLLQITGRANYAACGAAIGVDLLSEPDLLVTDWDVSALAAVWYWKSRVESRGKAMNVAAATRVVTGGLRDVDRRTQYSKEYMTTLA